MPFGELDEFPRISSEKKYIILPWSDNVFMEYNTNFKTIVTGIHTLSKSKTWYNHCEVFV